jgi:hypothetical protein
MPVEVGEYERVMGFCALRSCARVRRSRTSVTRQSRRPSGRRMIREIRKAAVSMEGR